MLKEKTEKLESIAAGNSLTLAKNFNLRYLSAHAFYEGPGILAERIESDMLSLAFYGVNCGFDSALKTALEKLSALVVSLTETESGNTKELAKIETAAAKIISSVKVSEYKTGKDVRDEIRKYLDTAVDAADAVVSLYGDGDIFRFVDTRQLEYLKESKIKLGGLSYALTGVLDITSAESAAYAEQVIDCLKAWRRDCAGFMCTSATVKQLDDAERIIEKWSRLVHTPTRREKAKSMPEYKSDDITLLGQSKASLETIGVFNARIETELKEIERREAELGELTEKRDSLAAELGATKKLEQQIVAEFRNTGDVAKANREAAALNRKKESITAELNRLERNGGIDRKKVDLQGRKLTADALKEVYDMLSENKNDPVFLARASRTVDFNALAAMFTGRFNAEDAARATDSIRSLRVRIDALNENRGAMLENLNLESLTTASVLSGTNSLKNTIKDTYGKTEIPEDGMSDELRRLMNMYTDDESEKVSQSETDDENLIIPLDDDDK